MATSGKLTLVYFDLKGRAEVTRLLLHAAGKDFEDKRVTGPSWEEYKPHTPMGQVPVLEVDGRRLCQSHAINKYLAEELGFQGKTALERYTVDLVQNLFDDLLQQLVKLLREKDEAKKDEIRKDILANAGPKTLNFLEELLKENGTGYFVGERITLADIYVLDLFTGGPSAFGAFPPVDDYPLLKANVERVKSQPKIAEYLANRKD